jgi:hypothetical protein
MSFGAIDPPVVLVVTEHWNKLTDKALHFALRLSPDVLAVHVTELEGDQTDDESTIRALWQREVEQPAKASGIRPPRLLLLRSKFRLMHDPLLKLVKELEGEFTDRTIAVLLPEMVKTSWWQFLLHTHRARRLHRKLVRFGGSKLVIISMPWYLEEPRIEEGMIEEAADTRAVDAESGSNILKLSRRFRKGP